MLPASIFGRQNARNRKQVSQITGGALQLGNFGTVFCIPVFKIPHARSFAKSFFVSRSLWAKVELTALKASKQVDLIYSVCGPLTLSKLTRKISLLDLPKPYHANSGLKLAHQAYKPRSLSANAGFLCLTPTTEKNFSEFAPSQFLPWCVDLEMFRPSKETSLPKKPFFFASGKTERDYETLVKAAPMVNAEIRIIGPSHLRPLSIPSNINWINTSYDPPDKAIDYTFLETGMKKQLQCAYHWVEMRTTPAVTLICSKEWHGKTCSYDIWLPAHWTEKEILDIQLILETQKTGLKMNLILSDQKLAMFKNDENRRGKFFQEIANKNIISLEYAAIQCKILPLC